MGEYALGMVQKWNAAVTRDVPTKPRKEEYVRGMVRSRNAAAIKDAPPMLLKGVCIRHGAQFKTCSHEGCTKYAQKGGSL